MTIAERLTQARKAHQLTQNAVAERLHVSRQTVSSWEQGRTFPDIQSLIALADWFNLSLDTLLRDDADLVAAMTAREKAAQQTRLGYRAGIATTCLLIVISVIGMLKLPELRIAPIVQSLVQFAVLANAVVAQYLKQRYDETRVTSEPKRWSVLMLLGLTVALLGLLWWRFGVGLELYTTAVVFVVFGVAVWWSARHPKKK